jgi:hypothetical protein
MAGQLARLPETARAIVDEAWQGGRDEAARELAAVLGRLIDDGMLASPAVLNALGPLIALVPAPDPGSHGARLEAVKETGPLPLRYAGTAPFPDRDEIARLADRFTRPYRGPLPGEVTAFRDRYAGLLGGEYAGMTPDALITQAEIVAEAAAQAALLLAGHPTHSLDGLPLADCDSEPAADAAGQRAGFSAAMAGWNRYWDEADARAAQDPEPGEVARKDPDGTR